VAKTESMCNAGWPIDLLCEYRMRLPSMATTSLDCDCLIPLTQWEKQVENSYGTENTVDCVMGWDAMMKTTIFAQP
jgi:hypothetical protein